MPRWLTYIYAILLSFFVLTGAEAREQIVTERTGASAAQWWFYTNVTLDELKAHTKKHKARIIDLDVNTSSPLRVSATLVKNAGAYKSGWWFYVGLSADQVNEKIAQNKARLIDVDPYHVNGKLRFAVIMVPNKGEAQTGWWWYYGQSMDSLKQKLSQNQARLVEIERYKHSGKTQFAAIMVKNTGAKAQKWWWYVGLSRSELKSKIFSHRARLLDLENYEVNGKKRFAAVLIPAAGESRWWWYHGLSPQDILMMARRLGARVVDIEVPGYGAKNYAALLTDNGMVRTGDCGGALKSFDQEIIKTMKRYQIPGASAAVIKDGRLVYACGFGYADLAAGTRATPTSLFRLASISKPLTVSALKKLEAQGALSLSDSMIDRLGSKKPGGPYKDSRLKNITLKQLVDHTAGWDLDKLGFDPMFYSNEIANALGTSKPSSCPTVMRYMFTQKKLNFAPGSDQFYSNFGYCVLGRVIEAQSGLDYETFVRAKILGPAGVKASMRVGRSLAAKRFPGEVSYYDIPFADPVTAVVPGGPKKVQRPDGGFHLEAMDAHGGWIASAIDIARFARFADPQPWSGAWNFEGSLPGTRSRVERNSDGSLVVALLFNTRPVDDLDKVIDRAVRRVRYWPTPDKWAAYGYGSNLQRAVNKPVRAITDTVGEATRLPGRLK